VQADLDKDQMRRLQQELYDFKKTSLYQHWKDHFQTLIDSTIENILEVDLKGPETLYAREGWIGEARSARLQIGWFEVLELELEQQLRDLQTTQNES